MVRIGLQIKATMDNVTSLIPEGQDFRWYLKIKCSNCGEVTEHWNYVTLEESHAIKGSRGNASMVSKCKFCSRESSMDIISDTIQPYNAEDGERFKTVIVFECRGIEPVDFSPRIGFTCTGVDSPARFEVDLTEKEWVEYDEHKNVSVGIFDLESQFIIVPHKK
ncbi:CXXC motif containing zinc binding protein-like [Amphiura filiformis]|uniref:CXXC motif containing zinc binding protein-like n=1 Tax=Amphiura filiformis TaxID=82378 RepID=UPI003B219BC0